MRAGLSFDAEGVGKLPVSVHVVRARPTCQPMPRSRNIAAHEYRASFLPRAVGADPGCGPGLHPCPRGPRGGARGRRPALGSDGPACDGTAAARLAHLITAPVERPASGDPETAS